MAVVRNGPIPIAASSLPPKALELTGRRLAGVPASPAGRPPGSGQLRRAAAGRPLVESRAAGSSLPSRWAARGKGTALTSLAVPGRVHVHNEFTAIIEKDGEWFIAYCPEIPGANGQGRTRDEARESLAEAIALILADRREDALRGVPADAEQDTVTVE